MAKPIDFVVEMTADVEVPDWVREYYELVDSNDFAGCAQQFAD
ncbi:MAG: hypothetical protein V7607_5942 [Solirubrobacteraceae bacterium]